MSFTMFGYFFATPAPSSSADITISSYSFLEGTLPLLAKSSSSAAQTSLGARRM